MRIVPRQPLPENRRGLPGRVAFSLLEVMIAVSIFFMAIFAILDLTSRSLKAARSLQPIAVDASSAAAELSLTNRLEEGPIPPEINQHFSETYPDYSLDGRITEVGTNGLFQVDFVVFGGVNGKQADSKMSVLLFRQPAGGRLSGGGRR